MNIMKDEEILTLPQTPYPETSVQETSILRDKNELIDETTTLGPNIKAFLFSLGCTENEVEDLVQETLRRAIEKIDDFKGKSKLSSWVFTIARNAFLDSRSRQSFKREITVGDSADPKAIEEATTYRQIDDPTQVNTDPAKILMEKDDKRYVTDKIEEIGEPYTSLLFAKGEGLTVRELAERFGYSVGTTFTMLNEAKERLKKALGDSTYKKYFREE